MSRSFDFTNCMDHCEIVDIGFIGPKYTWCNNSRPRKRVWKRLDRIFINDTWAHLFQNYTLKYLNRPGSDHRPLLFKSKVNQSTTISYFRFLNFWTKQSGFQDLIKEVWDTPIQGNPMWTLHQKMKILSNKLSKWSREIFSNVYDMVNKWGKKVEALEELNQLCNIETSRENLNKVQDEYIKCVIRERKRKCQIHIIKNHRGKWMRSEQSITKAGINHYEKLFNLPKNDHNMDIIDCIPKIVTEEDNDYLTKMPTEEEIKEAIFNISTDSVDGSDYFNGAFY
ncbi:uncharacterized protein [Nicotiana sylvestris]|uniref:uncharacterized protein n=1 Tax=Nicotiana sylvestris TaxID=4096 RepID=UPI00388CEBF3